MKKEFVDALLHVALHVIRVPRSRPYRRRSLQVKTRLKALDEIYTIFGTRKVSKLTSLHARQRPANPRRGGWTPS